MVCLITWSDHLKPDKKSVQKSNVQISGVWYSDRYHSSDFSLSFYYINLRVTWIAFDGIEGINHGEFISPKLVLEAQGRKVADKEWSINWAVLDFWLNEFNNWSVVPCIVDICGRVDYRKSKGSNVGRGFSVPYGCGLGNSFGSCRDLWLGLFFVDELELKLELKLRLGNGYKFNTS